MAKKSKKSKQSSKPCKCLGHHCHLCGRIFDNRGAAREYRARTKWHNICYSCAE